MKSFIFLSLIGLATAAGCDNAAKAKCKSSGHYCVPNSGSGTCYILKPAGSMCYKEKNHFMCTSKKCAKNVTSTSTTYRCAA